MNSFVRHSFLRGRRRPKGPKTGEFDGGNFEFFPKTAFSRCVATQKLVEIPECRRPTVLEQLRCLVDWEGARKLHETVDDRHRQLGPVFRMRVGPVAAVFVNSPDDYRRIFQLEGPTPQNFVPDAWRLYNEVRRCSRGLLFMSGDEWLHHRRIMNKLMLAPFTVGEIVASSCESAAIKLCNEWRRYADSGEIVPELEARLYRWSIEVMMSTLVGGTWRDHRESISREIATLADNLHEIFVQSAKLSLMSSTLAMKLRLPVWRRFVEVTDSALDAVRQLVPKVEAYSEDGLLSLMKSEGIRGENLTRIVADMIIAAGDTTAFSTQWALYLLSTHPEVQERILGVIESKGSEEIISDPYVKGVLRESLRLYPTAPFLIRFLPQDSVVGCHLIRKGELVIMSLYSSGRDETSFPEPEKFLPERWTRDEEKKYRKISNPFGSIPFALGARSCIGRKLAEAQMILTLSQLIKNYKISCDNAEQITMRLHLISVPSRPIELRLQGRQKI